MSYAFVYALKDSITISTRMNTSYWCITTQLPRQCFMVYFSIPMGYHCTNAEKKQTATDITAEIADFTHLGQPGHHCFSQWLCACSVLSHYLNQWWIFVNWVLRNTFQFNFNQNIITFIKKNPHKNVCKMVAILIPHQWVKGLWRPAFDNKQSKYLFESLKGLSNIPKSDRPDLLTLKLYDSCCLCASLSSWTQLTVLSIPDMSPQHLGLPHWSQSAVKCKKCRLQSMLIYILPKSQHTY